MINGDYWWLFLQISLSTYMEVIVSMTKVILPSVFKKKVEYNKTFMISM